MKIGILEISPRGHYTLVDSVVRIFASDKGNQLYICAHKNGENILEPLKTLFDGQIISIYWDPDTPLRLFFESINEIYLDRLYIITLDKYHKEFYSFKFNSQINIFIHNIDEWFNTSISYIFYHLFNSFVNLNSFLFKLKKNTIYNYYKRRLRKKLAKTGGKFVVLSSILKKELITFIPEHSIDVIPFSVYDPTLKDESRNNTSLRICLPGMVSEFRRDYYSIIKILLENITDFRNKIEIVLLGFISKKEFGFRVIKEFQKLIDEGLTVAYFDQDFIPIDIYDHELSKADIILGTVIVPRPDPGEYMCCGESSPSRSPARAARRSSRPLASISPPP